MDRKQIIKWLFMILLLAVALSCFVYLKKKQVLKGIKYRPKQQGDLYINPAKNELIKKLEDAGFLFSYYADGRLSSPIQVYGYNNKEFGKRTPQKFYNTAYDELRKLGFNVYIKSTYWGYHVFNVLPA